MFSRQRKARVLFGLSDVVLIALAFEAAYQTRSILRLEHTFYLMVERKALVLGFVTLSDVQQSTSGEVILMTLLGGTGTFFGPIVGAAVVVTLQQYLSDIVGGWVTAIIGAIFVACVLSFRRGIVGELAALRLRH